GEQWAILGANGSGKTSLLNTLSGFLQPTFGEIQVLGQIFGETDWADLRKVIGVINHTVADWINGNETALEIVIGGIHSQINYWGKITPEDEKTALNVLKRYKFAYAANRTWEQMSQGERQRTLICRAIMAKFQILILDEPCAGLDPIARMRFLEFVEGLASRKRNSPHLILVTHHVEEITPSFSHVLILKKGRIHAAGKKAEILTSDLLSKAFDADLTIRKNGDDYRLDV
ncbi:MAG: ATP-binding cassette domain-containing protein, partial [Verrucomicrobiota bacterium]